MSSSKEEGGRGGAGLHGGEASAVLEYGGGERSERTGLIVLREGFNVFKWFRSRRFHTWFVFTHTTHAFCRGWLLAPDVDLLGPALSPPP